MSHSHEVHAINKSLIIGLVLNGSYTILGFVFGIITGSLTLIADAIHNLTDNLTLGVSFVANRISTRKADAMRTFGYGRVTIIAAVINASFLIGVAIVVIMEAIAAGTPVFYCDPNLEEMMPQGVSVLSADPSSEGIAQTLTKTLSDTEKLRAMREAVWQGRDALRQSHQTKEMITLYESCAIEYAR